MAAVALTTSDAHEEGVCLRDGRPTRVTLDPDSIQNVPPEPHITSEQLVVSQHAVGEEELEFVEVRARHKYTIRRPRALQYFYRAQIVTAGDNRDPANPDERGESSTSTYLPEDVARERERIDLFIDLIWVGIIGNLSDIFSSFAFSPDNSDIGTATLIFTLAFLPSWRIWNAMRAFLNNYYMDDMLQQAFIFWILTLSVFYGNQLAYLDEDLDVMKTWVISTYILTLWSFAVIELVYSWFIPWLRKIVVFQFLLRLPSIGLWITAIFLTGNNALGPVVAAVAWEYLCAVIRGSAHAQRLVPLDHKKAVDVQHLQSRLANFFIIILGEGVLQLVKEGPLGHGFTEKTATMVCVLLIYYDLSFLYFARDGSKKFIPAATQHGSKGLFWITCHVPLFGSVLSFASGVLYIVRHEPPVASADHVDPSDLPRFLHQAVWVCAVSLAITTVSVTAIALLDRSLDEPNTLKVQNRYLRLTGRLIYIVVLLCVPIESDIDPSVFLAIAGILACLVVIWEWNASLDKGGTLIEPKGLTLMMSRELKDKHKILATRED